MEAGGQLGWTTNWAWGVPLLVLATVLFGLTAAFLFSMIQHVWPLGSRARRPQA